MFAGRSIQSFLPGHDRNPDRPEPSLGLPPFPNLLYVGGDTSSLAPSLDSLDQFNFDPEIIAKFRELRLCDNSPSGLTPLQRATAPNILNGQDSIIVGADLGTKTKLARTLSYLIPIVQELTPTSPLDKLTDPGPQVLLICSSVTSALIFEKFLNNLLNPPESVGPQFDVRVVYSGMLGIEKKLNSADILITNVNSAAEILIGGVRTRKQYGWTSRGVYVHQKRLKFLVLDEIDAYLSTDIWALKGILSVITKKPKKADEEIAETQLVVAGSQWSKELEAFHLNLKEQRKKPVCLFMDDVGEIVKFSGIQWRLDFAEDEENKLKILKEVVSQPSAHNKIIIACSTSENLRKIQKVCNEIASFKEILVLTDGKMITSNISGCTYLFSFGFEVDTSQRLSYLWRSLPKFVDGKWVRKNELVAHFLMTGKEPCFFDFYKFSRALNTTVVIHPKLEAVGSELLAKTLRQTPICRGVELWGSCNVGSTTVCNFRHEFNDTDFETEGNAPCYGVIELEITSWTSPSDYRANLVAHYSTSSGKRELVTSYRDELSRRSDLLKEYYSKDENTIYPSTFKRGSIYALKTGENPDEPSYKRVKLIGKRGAMAANMSSISVLDDVDLLCLDHFGSNLPAKTDELLLLPEEFSKWSPLALRVILTNIRPPHGEPEYPPAKLECLQLIVEQHVASWMVKAEVVASLGETVWVREINVVYKKNGQITSRNQLLRRLLNKHHTGLENRDHERLILDSFRGVGNKYHGHEHLILRKSVKELFTEEIFDFTKNPEVVQWAHLEISEVETEQVFPARIDITWGITPWMFYGVNLGFANIYRKLEEELNSWVAAHLQEEEDIWDNDLKRFLKPGSVVAAKDRESGEWARALIEEVGEAEVGACYDVFFVDFGNSCVDLKREEIYPLPKKFVSRLPFQAVAFSLSHIWPGGEREDWSEEEKEAFWEMIIPDGCRLRVDLAVTRKVEEVLDYPNPCRFYEAVALTNEGDELGSLLVRNGKAELVHDISSFVEALKNALETARAENINENMDSLDIDDAADVVPPHLVDLIRDSIANESEEEAYDELEEFYRRFDVNIPNTPAEEGSMMYYIAAQLSQLNPMNNPPPPPPATPEPSTSSAAAVALPPKKSGLLQPTVFWHQTTTHLILQVQLPDIKSYTLKLGMDKRSLLFRTQNPPNYGFNLKLFGKVKLLPEEELLTGHELKIKLEKRLITHGPWIRLMFEKNVKFWWAKEHPDFIKEEVDEEEAADIIAEKNYYDFMNAHRHLLQDDDDFDDDIPPSSSFNYLNLGDSDEDDSDEDDEGGAVPFLDFGCL